MSDASPGKIALAGLPISSTTCNIAGSKWTTASTESMDWLPAERNISTRKTIPWATALAGGSKRSSTLLGMVTSTETGTSHSDVKGSLLVIDSCARCSPTSRPTPDRLTVTVCWPPAGTEPEAGDTVIQAASLAGVMPTRLS